ncbi:MAG: hypothetical protein NT171_14230 [Planctomycetota bacterium]|nr:hypothetical protein [Planctomycetota bacterium]
MAFVHIYRWAFAGKKAHGHLGMVVQTPNGNKTYITMLNSGENNMFRENEGSAPSLPSDLRNMTGIRGAFDSDGMARHEALRRNPRFAPRADQKVVLAPDGDIHAPLAPIARRVSIRQAGPGDRPKTSLLLAQGQIYRPPTEIIELPVLTPDQLGIDTEKIFHWWKSYAGRATRQENTGTYQTAEIHNKYQAFSTHLNCAGTVYLALRVGGATFFKGRTFTRFYSTPDGVLKWAREVGTAVEEVNRAAMTTMTRYATKRAEFERKIGRNQQQNPEDLPTVEEWKRISHVGVFARRMDQIAVMDRELAHYHMCRWDDANQKGEKARALGQIMRSAEEHARLKPKSDRSHAVSYLISKAWEVLESRLVENPLPENDDWQGEERGQYASLAFSDAEFHELFMGDEWIVAPRDLEYADVVFEEQPGWEQLDGVRAIPRSRSQVHPPTRMDG